MAGYVLKSVSNNVFVETDDMVDNDKVVFIPTNKGFVSTKGEPIFYREFFYDEKKGLEWKKDRKRG